METITEDYCSYEVAQLLKYKGFDEPTAGTYYKDGAFEHLSLNKWNSKFIVPISAPTLQMAMKWLREVHNIFINIIYENDGVFTANIKVLSIGVNCKVDNKHNCWLTYEEAAELAIKYCLENLI